MILDEIEDRIYDFFKEENIIKIDNDYFFQNLNKITLSRVKIPSKLLSKRKFAVNLAILPLIENN